MFRRAWTLSVPMFAKLLLNQPLLATAAEPVLPSDDTKHNSTCTPSGNE